MLLVLYFREKRIFFILSIPQSRGIQRVKVTRNKPTRKCPTTTLLFYLQLLKVDFLGNEDSRKIFGVVLLTASGTRNYSVRNYTSILKIPFITSTGEL